MSPIILVQAPITRRRLKEIAEQRFGDMVKGVVDLEKQVIALGGELHADEEAFLLREGSAQKSLWASTCIQTFRCQPCWSLTP
jgi:hypothetical protein